MTRTTVERFRLFIERVDKLMARSAITQATVRANFAIRAGVNHPLQQIVDIGDEEHFRSLMLDFRRFMAESEDTFFPSIANLVEQELDDTECRENFRVLRGRWKRAMSGPMGLTITGQNLRAERCFELLVNGDLFHDDAAKAAIVAAMPADTHDLMRLKMANLVIDCIKILVVARNNLRAALDQTPSTG